MNICNYLSFYMFKIVKIDTLASGFGMLTSCEFVNIYAVFMGTYKKKVSKNGKKLHMIFLEVKTI